MVRSFNRAIPIIGIITILCMSLPFASINTGGNRGNLRTVSAQGLGKARLNLVVGVNYAQDGQYVKGPVNTSNNTVGNQPINISAIPPETLRIVEPARLFSSNLSACFGLASFWDLGLSLPFYYDWSGFDPGWNEGGIGDLEVSTKLRQPPIGKIFFQSYYISVTAPVGMQKKGIFVRHPYLLESVSDSENPAKSVYSYSAPIIKAMILWSLDFGLLRRPFPLSINANVGGAFSTDWEQRNLAIGGFSIDYTPADFISIFIDMNAEARWNSFGSGVNILRDPFYCSPGIRINTPAGLYILIAGDFSLSSTLPADRNNWEQRGFQYSTAPAPKYGVQFQLGWNGFLVPQDDDKDGLTNALDRCPKEAEDIDNFEDADGCADPDNDKDGICDPWVSEKRQESKYASVCKGIDKCPNDPEDKDGFQDDDGCPDPDNDKDGIPDTRDQCPDQPEDFDGIEDKDGCPDTDNDKDAIPDSMDKCPNDPEDIDGFQDNDGCPDPDNDMDGIPDLKDKCPNQPESFNAFQDDDGCPDTLPPPPPKKKEADIPRSQTLRGVSFRTGTADITPDSYVFMDPIIRKLKEYPEVEIEIRGYTDSLGKYETNMILSQQRAEAVRQYLISQGIDGQRIRSVGMGSTNPIADNRTAAGRSQNRRIEVVRLK